MKKQSNSGIIFRSFIISAAYLIFLMTGERAFGQIKTSTASPCVDIVAANAKNVNRVWANQNLQTCRQAIVSLRSASVLILGRDLQANNGTDDYVLQEWLIKIGSNPSWKAKFDGGLKATYAMNWLKETADPGEYRIYRIFQDVHGRDGDQLEQSLYMTAIKEKKAWYATIFADEVKRLNDDSLMRGQMINRSYQSLMGRNALANEIQYWKPRKEFYRQIISASRIYLYAPGNEELLKEVVRRKLAEQNGGNPPSAEMIAKAMENYKSGKKIFSEM